ncbi:acetolactate decarboxylase [Pseudodesulfovibrio sp. JC047]|uniref:acetolactate decarboxylase n=1 Tax=Pseudodesulfovibrio sp. JC047 TaxID=2683199 RepID=UPI001EF33C19|nr:acetolactate decarboxylase [Pseudodesulfovibrio sp. JC047]
MAQTLYALLLFLVLTPFSHGFAHAGDDLFQYSTIDALLAGLYDGDMSIKNLMTHGNFGLGTLNGLDGELVVLDGTPYHIRAGGKATVPPETAMVPFATVSCFEEDTILKLERTASLDALNTAVELGLPSKNIFYAIRIDGRFPFVKARAIPKQNPPYAPLHEVVKFQEVVQFSGEGTLIGYYSPPFVKGINVPGFHWHFITKDRTGGGHVLDCSLAPTTARMDALHSLTVSLPNSREFNALDLTHDASSALETVEKGTAQ